MPTNFIESHRDAMNLIATTYVCVRAGKALATLSKDAKNKVAARRNAKKMAI